MYFIQVFTVYILISIYAVNCKRSAVIHFPDGGSYKGTVSDGKPNGKGKLVLPELKYEGDFIDGKRHGNGVQFWKKGLHEGESYLGEWKNDERDGYGIHIWPDGRKYTGVWKKNRQNGKGVLTNASGDSYNGMFKDDQPDGQGLHTKADGSILYQGIWSNGKPLK